MKLKSPIPMSKIPSRTPGTGDRSHSATYDVMLRLRLDKLAPGNVLPIECESIEECLRVQYALKIRGYASVRRRTTLYASVEKIVVVKKRDV